MKINFLEIVFLKIVFLYIVFLKIFFLKIAFLIGCLVFGWNDELRRTDPTVLRKGSLPRFATMIRQKDLLYYIYIPRTGAFWM